MSTTRNYLDGDLPPTWWEIEAQERFWAEGDWGEYPEIDPRDLPPEELRDLIEEAYESLDRVEYKDHHYWL